MPVDISFYASGQNDKEYQRAESVIIFMLMKRANINILYGRIEGDKCVMLCDVQLSQPLLTEAMINKRKACIGLLTLKAKPK